MRTILEKVKYSEKLVVPTFSKRLVNISRIISTRVFIISIIAAMASAVYVSVNEAHAYGSDAFVMVVKTDNPGSSASNEFTIRTNGTGIGYNYNVDCNDDGVNEFTAATDDRTCVYGSVGTYTIAITGTFPQIKFDGGWDKDKLLEVKQWGTGAWSSMQGAFSGTSNLTVTATDVPNLSNVTSMNYMFGGATSLNQPLNDWDVSNVTDMSYMFIGTSAFNQPLNNWNVNNVTDMSGMFYNATSFNQPLDNWDVSSVTSMDHMFFNADTFNQPLSNWNVSSVTQASSMFGFTEAFNQPLDNWNVGNVIDMSYMFYVASAFDQPLNSWNVSNVTDMNNMFRLSNFNQPLSNWNVSNVTDMSYMFSNATAFNQPLNSWNVGSVTNMNSMFLSATSFNQPLDSWNVSNVSNMHSMFWSAGLFNQALDSWNVGSVSDMSLMFYDATAFNQPLNSWDVSSVTNMNNMFAGANSFNQPLNNWNVGNVVNMSSMFVGAVAFNQPIASWNVSSVSDMSAMFMRATSFNQPLDIWNVSNVTDMSGMFDGATAFDQSLGNWNISSVSDFSAIFHDTALSITTYQTTLAGWATNSPQPSLTLGARGVKYCDDTGRSILTSPPNSWTIQDGGLCEPSVSYPQNNSIVSTKRPTVTGVSIPNGTVSVKIGSSVQIAGSDNNGSFSVAWAADLTDGWKNASIYVTNAAGTQSGKVSIIFYISSEQGDVKIGGTMQQPTISWQPIPQDANPVTVQWSETSSSAFSARGSFGSVSFNDKLWVMGGQSDSTRFNDIWSSTDGTNWTQVVASAPWSARNAHQTVVFDNKLWVIGGQAGPNRLNDVWSSPDGTNWTRVVANAPWVGRSAHKVIVHDNKMWIVGGMENGTSTLLEDVWSSPDGVTWTEEASDTPWEPRMGFAAVSFLGKMWVLGGVVDGSTHSNDIWSSSDGVTWTEVTDQASWPVRASHQAVVHDNRMWVLGGSAEDWSSEYSDAWYSYDGIVWFDSGESDWVARRGHSAAVHDNKMWVIGGRVGSGWNLSSDVWSGSVLQEQPTYKICWDTVLGGCRYSAMTKNTTYTLESQLTEGLWYFGVSAAPAFDINLGAQLKVSQPPSLPEPSSNMLTGDVDKRTDATYENGVQDIKKMNTPVDEKNNTDSAQNNNFGNKVGVPSNKPRENGLISDPETLRAILIGSGVIVSSVAGLVLVRRLFF